MRRGGHGSPGGEDGRTTEGEEGGGGDGDWCSRAGETVTVRVARRHASNRANDRGSRRTEDCLEEGMSVILS